MRFFLIDRITLWEIGRPSGPPGRAEALKNVALSEDFFDDHFPRHPVMPGVLILEGLAQLSGLLLEESLSATLGRRAKAVLTVLERTKFRRMVRPGDTLTYRAQVSGLSEAGGKSRVEALRGSEPVATSEMVFAFQEAADPRIDEMRKALLDLWLAPPAAVPQGAAPAGDGTTVPDEKGTEP
jgi:3-hydroxyacyl-[acyl-carrier-protein] dehydratase